MKVENANSLDEHVLEKAASNASAVKLDDERKQQRAGTATPSQITVNVVTATLSLKFLYLPSQVVGASLFMGLVITALAMLLCGWSLMILIEAAEKYQTFDIGSLCRRLPGKLGQSMEMFVNGIIWLATFLGVIYLMILLCDVMGPATGLGRKTIIIFGSMVATPTLFLPQHLLSFTSSLAILMNAYIFLLVSLYSSGVLKRREDEGKLGEISQQEVCWLGFGNATIVLFCGVVSGGTIHPAALQMYYGLADRSVAKFRRIIVCGFSIAYFLFVSFQTIGALGFGVNVNQNILGDLPNNTMSDMARVGMILLVLGNYPFGLGAMIAPFQSAYGDEAAFKMKFVIVFCVMCASFILSDLGKVGVFGGAVGLIGLNALPPGLVGMYLVGRRPSLMVLLIAMGSVLFVIALVKPGIEQMDKDAMSENCFLK